MTRMIPEAIHSSVESAAERRMFEIIRDAPDTHRWVCFHSLGLAHHDTKRRAEIDFVLLTHHGIFVLEVKGGRLKRSRGVWYSIDKDNVAHKLAESPFDQAAGAMFALQKRIKEHFRSRPHADALFGYGVVTPDFTFDLDSPESDRRQVYDIRDTERPFTSFINRLAEYAREREARDKRPALKPEAIEELANYLRGDFDFIPQPDVVFDDLRKQLDRLTKEQRVVLDALEDSKRVIVDGGAGTGKTLLAIDAARRMAKTGDRVLFLCFNKLLAARLEHRLSVGGYKGDLVVRHLHRYLFELIEGTEWEQLVIDEIERDPQNAFDQMLPEYAALVASDRPEARFDAIVIDEAQDILTETNLEALNEVLHGGLEEGRWCIFLDGREQARVYGKMEESALQRLRALSVYERLTLNCRNTRPIAQQTAVVSNSKWGVSARIDGRPVDFKPYRHRSGWLDELERVLKELTQDGVPPGRISVLVLRKKIPDQDKKRLEHIGLRRLNEEDAPNLGSSALEQTTWSTVSGFKGLENDVVVVAGVTDIDDDWDRSVAYVGMSRARSRLHVIIHEECDKKRKEREKEWKARQDSDVEMLL